MKALWPPYLRKNGLGWPPYLKNSLQISPVWWWSIRQSSKPKVKYKIGVDSLDAWRKSWKCLTQVFQLKKFPIKTSMCWNYGLVESNFSSRTRAVTQILAPCWSMQCESLYEELKRPRPRSYRVEIVVDWNGSTLFQSIHRLSFMKPSSNLKMERCI